MNRARRDHLCRAGGPAKNAVSAMSANASDGTWARRHNMCEHFTRICTQYVQMIPTTNVDMRPNQRPPFAKANGIDKIPEPNDPFNKWINVSPSLQSNVSIWLENWIYDFMNGKGKYKKTIPKYRKSLKRLLVLTLLDVTPFDDEMDCNHMILHHVAIWLTEMLNLRLTPMLIRSPFARHSFRVCNWKWICILYFNQK